MNKQQYLEAQAAWKVEHVQRILNIRQAKLDIKSAQRSGSGICGAYVNLRHHQSLIISHLCERERLKEAAQRDYWARKEAAL